MIEAMRAATLLFAAIVATGVVLERDPAKQAVTTGFYGLTLTLVFLFHQAPDVALSQAVIGAVVLPLMVMLALATLRKEDDATRRRSEGEGPR